MENKFRNSLSPLNIQNHFTSIGICRKILFHGFMESYSRMSQRKLKSNKSGIDKSTRNSALAKFSLEVSITCRLQIPLTTEIAQPPSHVITVDKTYNSLKEYHTTYHHNDPTSHKNRRNCYFRASIFATCAQGSSPETRFQRELKGRKSWKVYRGPRRRNSFGSCGGLICLTQ